MAQENPLEAKSNLGHTPLHLAVIAGNIDAAIVLIKMGADVDAQDRQGKTPLMHAAKGGHYGLMNLLLGSSKKTGEDFVKYLDTIFEKPDINHQDVLGRTRLHYCAIKGDSVALKSLLDKGADKDIRDNEQMTALDYAQGMQSQSQQRKSPQEKIQELDKLIAKSDINAQEEKTGKTALHYMAINGDHVGYKYLISKGAKTDIKDNAGKTASDYLAKQELSSTVAAMGRLSVNPAPRPGSTASNTNNISSSSSSTPGYKKQ